MRTESSKQDGRLPFSDAGSAWSETIVRTLATLTEANRTAAEFLLTDAQLGLTFVDLAGTRRNPAQAQVALGRAREALVMINRHLSKLSSDAGLLDAVERARDELEARIAATARQLTRSPDPLGLLAELKRS